MKVEIDRGAIFAAERPVVTGRKTTGGIKSEVVGRVVGNKIFLATNYPIRTITAYCHEAGHFVGDFLSFKQKRLFGGPKNVLSFDEIKKEGIAIDLSEKEQALISKFLRRRRKLKPDFDQITIAKKLLLKFFKGDSSFEKLEVYALSRQEMREEVASRPGMGTEKRGSRVVSINTKQARNVELPAVYAQVACLLILENTIRKYGLGDKDWKELAIHRTAASYQQRAQNIVGRAYNGNGWRIPSMVDLSK